MPDGLPTDAHVLSLVKTLITLAAGRTRWMEVLLTCLKP